jgi:hypothetical protein
MSPVRRPARRGEEYERWVHAHAALICSELGLDMEDLRVRREVPLAGRLRYRVDVLAEAGDDVVVIECKDSRPSPQELLYAHHRVVDLARAMPDKTFHGVVMAAKAPGASGLELFDPQAPLLPAPPNLAAPMKLFVSPPRLLARHLLLWRLTNAHVEASVIRVSGPERPLPELLAGLHDPGTRARLVAAVETLAHDGADEAVQLDAAAVAANAFHHLGSGVDTHYAADVTAHYARLLGSRSRLQEAEVLRAFASYRVALDAGRHRAPGVRVVKRLNARIDDLEGVQRASALQLLGPWHGLYGDRELGIALLRRSLDASETVRTADEASYLQFIGQLRLAEIDHGSSEQWQDQATRLMPVLAARHREWAEVLIARMTAGRDVSIASRLPLHSM